MSTKDDRIEKALDTLAEICDMREEERDSTYGRRAAAEEILRHYREEQMFTKGIIVRIEGHVPVRPVERAK